MVLLLTTTFVFAVLLTSLTRSTDGGYNPPYNGDTDFSDVTKSLLTCFILALVPNLNTAINEVSAIDGYCLVAFGLYIFICAIAILHLMVGIIVDMASCLASVEKESKEIRDMKFGVQEYLFTSEHGRVDCSMQDFVTFLENDDARKFMRSAGVDFDSLIDYLDVLFKDKNSVYSYSQVVGVLLDCRSGNYCTVKDI